MDSMRIAAALILALSLAGCHASPNQETRSADGPSAVELGKGAGDLAQLEPGEFARPPGSAQDEAQSAASQPKPDKPQSRAEAPKPIRFDYRVLAPPESGGAVYRATWEGPVALANSKFIWLRLGVAFEVTSQEVADKFKPMADDYRALTDCLTDVVRMRRSPQLQGPEAMEDVKESLVEAVDRFFGATVVREAYFTQYHLGYR
ncbi:MAG: flagellar basal body-associated FliL family protein [Candidatus Sumerlaeota bacterium]|nr:flagellar basal body-associated FliL family protein [Candidatus Sumerlaeota bacterium]